MADKTFEIHLRLTGETNSLGIQEVAKLTELLMKMAGDYSDFVGTDVEIRNVSEVHPGDIANEKKIEEVFYRALQKGGDPYLAVADFLYPLDSRRVGVSYRASAKRRCAHLCRKPEYAKLIDRADG